MRARVLCCYGCGETYVCIYVRMCVCVSVQSCRLSRVPSQMRSLICWPMSVVPYPPHLSQPTMLHRYAVFPHALCCCLPHVCMYSVTLFIDSIHSLALARTLTVTSTHSCVRLWLAPRRRCSWPPSICCRVTQPSQWPLHRHHPLPPPLRQKQFAVSERLERD